MTTPTSPARSRAGEATPARPPWRIGRLGRAHLAVLGLLVLVTRLPGLVTRRAFNTDENTLGVGGRALADGGALYVDVIDRKPPLPFLAYRFLATDDFRPVRGFVALLILAAALVVADEAARRWGDRAGWVAGLVMALGPSALGPLDAQAANFELFALLPIVVAVVAAARGWAATAGAALAVAVLCKQPAAVTIVPVAWWWWQTRRWAGVGRGLVGGAVATLVLTAPFGLWRVVEWALLGTGSYLALGGSELTFALLRLLALVGITVGFWGGAWLLAAAWRPAGSLVARTERWADPDLWLLLGASCVGVVAGFRFFPHYLTQLLPALALLAGRGVVRRPSWRWLALTWAVVGSLVGAALSWQVVFTDPPRYEQAVADFARANSAPGDEILVWGNEPGIYWLSDRQPAGGFTHSEFFTGYSGGRPAAASSAATVPDEELYREWIERLEADPPVLVFDTAAAFLRGGKWFPIRGYPELTRLLDERYERVDTIRGVPAYRLLDAEAPP